MPSWILCCPHCNSDFTHSEIIETAQLDVLSQLLPVKPLIAGTQQMECPSCHKTVNYTRYDLRYAGS
jgi:hypothetical protein